jgi:uncharacterized membrane protein
MQKVFLSLVNLTICFIVVISLNGCYYDVEEELYPNSSSLACDTSNVRYSVEVKGILDTRCNGCHSGANPSANIQLGTYAGVKSYLDASSARFLSSINQDGNASSMPQNQPRIPNCEISKISIWIAAGYPEN